MVLFKALKIELIVLDFNSSLWKNLHCSEISQTRIPQFSQELMPTAGNSTNRCLLHLCHTFPRPLHANHTPSHTYLQQGTHFFSVFKSNFIQPVLYNTSRSKRRGPHHAKKSFVPGSNTGCIYLHADRSHLHLTILRGLDSVGFAYFSAYTELTCLDGFLCPLGM